MLDFVISLTIKILDLMDLRKIFLFIGLVTVMLTGIVVFENRQIIFNIPDITKPKPINIVGGSFYIDKDSQEKIKNIVHSNSKILGISVRNADIRLNKDIGIYYYGKNNAVTDLYYNYNKYSNDVLPLWSTDQDLNKQIIRLINGDFYCIPFKNTFLYSLRPDLSNEVKTVCRVSLPPYYGYFTGFLTFYINDDLSLEEMNQLKTIAQDLSNYIYQNDVVKTFRKIGD